MQATDIVKKTGFKSSFRRHDPRHTAITLRLIAETVVIFVALSVSAYLLLQSQSVAAKAGYCIVLFLQGLWLDRLYIVGHEATHKKLFPESAFKNDVAGMLMLMPLLVPLRIYRKIHAFHHGFNRKDHHTSVLDVFVTKKPLNVFKKAWFYFLWFAGVFLGGYFIHSIVSIMLFLLTPTSLAVKISPAFKGWTFKDKIISWVQFSLGIAFHFAVFKAFGFDAWLAALGLPFIVFAWVWSLLVYIFHYNTTIGPDVRYNARSLKRNPFFAWLFMNFNEHATHHAKPNIPWYELPVKKEELPERFKSNENVETVFQAITQQLKGPVIIHEHHHKES